MKIPIRVDTALYYPAHIYEMGEFKALAACFDRSLQPLWEVMEQIYSDQYLDELDGAGCRMHEEFLGIRGGAGDTLTDRRKRIKGHHASGLPYTENKLNEVLATMCGIDGYSLVIDKHKKTAEVCIGPETSRLMEDVQRLMGEFLPADMQLCAATKAEGMEGQLHIGTAMGRGYTVTTLPEIRPGCDMCHTERISAAGMGDIMETILPGILGDEEDGI